MLVSQLGGDQQAAFRASELALIGPPPVCTDPFDWLSGSTCELTTSNAHHYKIIDKELPPGQCIFFEAIATNDIHVSLFSASTVIESPFPGGYYPDPTSVSFYEIVIGGWDDTLSTIRTSGQGFDSGQDWITGSWLGGGAGYMPFWVCADVVGGIVTTGAWTEMQVGEVIASANYPPSEMMPINYIGFSTGWGSTGGFRNIRVFNLIPF